MGAVGLIAMDLRLAVLGPDVDPAVMILSGDPWRFNALFMQTSAAASLPNIGNGLR